MHYTGTIWRPPYEAGSLLIEVTAGCTHHRCKFCTLYDDLPFPFRMSPLEDIEADLQEAKAQLERWGSQSIKRIYLVGANPFVLRFERLKAIAELIHTYIPACQTIGCFARVTDVTNKTDAQLQELRQLGYTGLTIGVETGDDTALNFMHKGYQAQDIITQTKRLDQAQITYNFIYLTGIAGKSRGSENAQNSAAIFNQTHPRLIGSSMLTVYPESVLYQEIQAGNWQEAGELEKLEELAVLIDQLNIPVYYAALGASNAIQLQGHLPEDKELLLSALQRICQTENEAQLRRYRTQLKHL